jgi:WD40 repeat protein
VELDRAEAIVKELLSPKYLSTPQQMVFRAAWQGQSYRNLAESAGYDQNYLKGVGAQVWRILATATKSKVTKANFKQIVESFADPADLLELESEVLPSGIDWGEAMDVSAFYGRELERRQIQQWILTDRCRLVAILGMGGMGKTTISIELLRQFQAAANSQAATDSDGFDRIIWRSLLNAPPLKELLPELIRMLVIAPVGRSTVKLQTSRNTADRVDFKPIPKTVTGQIELLLEICQEYRCLIVLDNGESIFQSGAHVGQYLTGYGDYGDLFQTLGRMNHQSCLLLTSREKPTEISQLEGVNTKIRTLVLPGLDPAAGQQIFADRGCLPIESLEWTEIDRYCGGNPLALQLIAATVQEVADGDVSEIFPYLQSNKLGFADIHILLDQQWERLTAEEQQVMYWLAIGREPMPMIDLEGLLHPAWNQQAPGDHRPSGRVKRTTANSSLLTVLQSLRRRSIMFSGSGQLDQSKRYWSLQPMVMEYVTSRFVDRICTEIEEQQPFLLNTHPISQANAKEYLRQAQLRLIVQPAIDRLRNSIGNPQQIGTHLRLILATWRSANSRQPGYLAGNLLNFLTYLKLDLTNLDCSELVIQQAYLVGIELAQVNFANAQIVDCAFTQTFSSILAIAYSPDGKTLAASDSSGEIRLWCVRDGQCLLTCSGHTNWVRAIKFSPDGRYLASSSDDRTIKIWDLQEGICLQTIGDGIHSLGFSFSPDGRYIASGSVNHTIYYWDLQTGACVREFSGHQDWSIDIKFHPQGHQIISGGADRTVRVWDVATGNCDRVLLGHDNWVTTVDYAPDGNTILSGGLDGTLRLWGVGSGERGVGSGELGVGSGELGAGSEKCGLGVSPSGAPFQDSGELEGDPDLNCRLVVRGHGDEIWSAAFSPDGRHFASAGVGGLLKIWRTSDGYCLHYLEGHSKRLWSVAFHPDGHCLASGGEDQTIRFWQIDDGKCLQSLNGYTNWFRSIAWSPDGQRLVTASRDAQLRVWSLHREDCLQSLLGHTKSTFTVAYDPQGLTFASGGDDRTIRIWDAQSLTCSQILRGHTGGILALVYSPDGKYLVSAGSDLSIRIWDTHRWRCLHVKNGHTDRIGGLAYHPWLDLIASAGEDCTVRIWSFQAQEPVQILSQHTNRAIAVTFDPGGMILASGGIDSQILLWNIETGKLCHTLTGHSGWILALAYSPDGQWLFSGASDDTIKVWSMATGLCIDTLVGHQSWVWSLAVSRCGAFLASASEDETIRIWDLADGRIFSTRRACRPYEGMNITGIEGLSKAQVDGLKILGAKR